MAVRHWRSGAGGVVFDWDLKSTLEGLYVAGTQGVRADHSQAAATGRYAGRNAAEYARAAKAPAVDQKQLEAEKARVYAPVQRKGEIGWKELKAGLTRVMQDYCGEYKNEGTLKLGLDWLKSISESEAISVYARNPHELARTVECLTHITLGEMLLHAALARIAGGPSGGSKTIRLEKGTVIAGDRPARWWLKPPYAFTYGENYSKHCGL